MLLRLFIQYKFYLKFNNKHQLLKTILSLLIFLYLLIFFFYGKSSWYLKMTMHVMNTGKALLLVNKNNITYTNRKITYEACYKQSRIG